MRARVRWSVLLPMLALTWVPRPAEGQLRLGAYAGLSRAEVSSEELGTITGSRDGLLGGAFLEWALSEIWGVRLAAQYTQKGFTLELPSEPGVEDFTVELQVDYFEVPLLATFWLPTEGNLGATVFGGPVGSFKSSCVVHVEGQDASLSADCGVGEGEDLEIDDALKSFDFGVMVGGALTYDLERAQLFAGVSHNWGLTTFIEDDEADPDVDQDARHRALGVMAGVSFPVGR